MAYFYKRRFLQVVDAGWDRMQDRTELARLIETSQRELSREFDWNDRTTLFEGGPRAARDRRASRFADC